MAGDSNAADGYNGVIARVPTLASPPLQGLDLVNSGLPPRLQRGLRVAVVLCLVLATGGLGWVWMNAHDVAAPIAQLDLSTLPYEEAEPEFVVEATEHHKAIRETVDYSPVTKPTFVDAVDSVMPDDSELIGVVIEGVPYGFLKLGLANPTRHIVSVVLQGRPLAITYCDLSECVRVFQSTESEQPIELHVAGLDADYGMVVSIDGTRYAQKSEAIPLSDFPFEITTLGEWKKRYPRSHVYPR